ncbi:unnamed protein product, partial [Prorocentrum cordatum]
GGGGRTGGGCGRRKRTRKENRSGPDRVARGAMLSAPRRATKLRDMLGAARGPPPVAQLQPRTRQDERETPRPRGISPRVRHAPRSDARALGEHGPRWRRRFVPLPAQLFVLGEMLGLRVHRSSHRLDGRYGLSRVCLKPTVRGLATGTAHRSGRSTVSSATSRRGGCSRRLPPFAVLSASSALPALQVLENTLGLDLLRGGRGGQATRRPRHFEDFVHTDVSWTSACDTCIDSGRVLRVLNVEDRLPLSPYLFARPRATRAASVATCAVARNAATGTTAAHPAPRAAGTRPASEDQTTRAASAHSARYASRSPKKDWRGHSRGCSLDGSPRLQPASPPALPPHPHGPARLPNRASSFAAGSRRTRYASRGAPSSGARSTAEARIAALFLNVQHFWPRLASQSRGS